MWVGNILIKSFMMLSDADVQTAVVAKEALEGHCIYDGGFCKLHISYSRHTDLSIKVSEILVGWLLWPYTAQTLTNIF